MSKFDGQQASICMRQQSRITRAFSCAIACLKHPDSRHSNPTERATPEGGQGCQQQKEHILQRRTHDSRICTARLQRFACRKAPPKAKAELVFHQRHCSISSVACCTSCPSSPPHAQNRSPPAAALMPSWRNLRDPNSQTSPVSPAASGLALCSTSISAAPLSPSAPALSGCASAALVSPP